MNVENKNATMSKISGAVEIDTQRCKGCLLCVEACPKNVLELAKNKVNARGYGYVLAVREEECIGCASCGIVCPDGCITVYRLKE